MKLHQTFRRFVQSEQFGGVLLLACTIVSLVLANSPFCGSLARMLWHVKLGPLSIEHWINDALMAVFFLMIGLELERGCTWASCRRCETRCCRHSRPSAAWPLRH